VKKSRRKKLRLLSEDQPRGPLFRVPLPVILLIALIALAIYSPALRGPFIWDDELLIQDNPHVTSLDQTGRLFTEDVEASGGEKSALYRPLMMVTLALDYGLGRLCPVGYHVANVVWHIAVALMVFSLAFLLFEDAVPALIASLLFVVHPVHTEAVSYISGRSDPMSVLFMLGALFVYIRRPFPAAANFFAIVIAYAACLLSRESGLILPALILFYHGVFKKKIDGPSLGAVLVLAAAYGILRFTALDFLMPHASDQGSLGARLPGFFAAFLNYLRLLVWPADLHMEYGTVFFRPTDPQAAGGLAFLLAALGCLAFAWRRSRLAAFGIGWFLIGLLPFSNLFPINAYMAEHWLYLASIGIFLLVAQGLYALYRHPRLKKLSLGLIAALVGFYGALTFIHNNNYWRDPVLFYERTWAYAPYSWRVANNLGTTYQEKGELDKAEAYLFKAIALKPDNAGAYNNLGVVYSRRRQPEEAIAHLNKALSLDPQYVEAYRNLGNAHRKAGRPEEAAAAYAKALSVRPDYALAYAGLGNLAQDKEDYGEAVRLYEKALDIDPGCVEAYNNLGAIKQKAGEGKALDYYRQAIERDPKNPDAYANLALAYQQVGRYEEAQAMYKRLFDLAPAHVGGRNNLGSLYQAMGRIGDAIASYEKSLEADPECAYAYFNLGNIYRKTGRLEEATEMYKKAALFDPDYVDARINLGAMYQMSGSPELAVKAYEEALEIDPGSLEAVMNLALIFQGQGDVDAAEAYYEKAIAIDPDNGATYNNIGLMRQGQEDFVGAEGMYRKAVEVDPRYAEAYNNLAVLCMRSGRSQEAFEALTRSVEADPSFARGYHNLAIYCHGAKDYEQARRYLEKAKALGFRVDARLESDLEAAVGSSGQDAAADVGPDTGGKTP